MSAGKRYRILDFIGAGGMSVVHRAEDRLTHEVVALKQMHIDTRKLLPKNEDGETGGDILALAQEFRALASLRHPHIVPVLDYGFDETHRPFLTMELVDDARNLLEAARTLDEVGKIELLIQLLNALMYLHRRGIIHHDLKPDNVLVSVDGTLKVLDFGLAVNTSLSLTGERGGLSGTMAYLAPELFQNPQVTVQSDLFAVGIMAYEMFVGKYPFADQNTAMLLYNILHAAPDLSMFERPLADVLERLLAKDPTDRYQTAQEVIQAICAATGFPEPLESKSLQDSFLQASEFIGRKSEFEELKSALHHVLENANGSAWLIGGESGVGKSRLIDELRIRAITQGALVFQGQATSEGGQLYQMWRDPMRHLVLSTEIALEDASVLKEIIPDIESIVGYDVSDSPALEGRGHKERLINSMMNTFRKQTSPMILIVEDLHWAVESLEPLQLLLNHVTNLPLMIIGSYRHDEAPQISEQLPAMKRIRLERLDDDEIAQLSASILGDVGVRPDLLELLKRETEGNTFFIVEVIRALGQTAGRLSEIGQAMLPETVFSGGINQVVQRRLDRVPDWARPMLQLAATAGRTLDLTLLDAIYQQFPDAVSAEDFKLAEWLTICSDMAVLDVPNGVWRFSHEKLRETLLSQLAPSDCTEAHRMIAETLERIYPADISRAEILAEHWYQANNIERELPHLCRIVEYYIDKSTGLDTARNLLQRALDRLDEHDPRRVMLLVYLSQTYIRIDYGFGEEIGLRALDAAQAHGDDRATAQALYVLGSHVREQMRYEEAEAYSQKSLALFQKINDRRGSANNLVSLGIINHDLARYKQARTYYDQSLAIYHELQDEGRVAFLEILIGTLARDQKQFDEAVPRIENGLEIARRIGQISIISHALNNLGMIATERGDFEKAKHFLLQSLSVNRYVGNQWGLANCYINLGFIHLMLNADDRARNSLMEGIKKAVAIRAMNLALEGVVGLGWLYERSGQFQKAAYVIGMAEPIANIDVNRRIIPLMARLKRHMTPESLQAALQQGSTLDLDTIIANLLDESDQVGTG